MSGKSINFEVKKINKINFYKNKKIFNIHNLDVNKILVSKKESYGTKTMFFKVSDNKLKKIHQNMGKSQQFNEYKIW